MEDGDDSLPDAQLADDDSYHPSDDEENIQDQPCVPSTYVVSGRFRNINEEDVQSYVDAQKNTNTKRKTEGHMKIFTDFLILKGETAPVAQISPERLDQLLSMFFLSVQKQSTTDASDLDYEPSTIKGMQLSI